MRKLLSFFVASLLFTPSFCQAQAFTPHQEKLLFQPDTNLYRLRQTSKPWQLVGLPTGFLPERIEYFGGSIFLIAAKDGRKQILSSLDGMRFSIVATISGEQLTLKTVGGFLVAAAVDGGVIKFFAANSNLLWQAIANTQLSAIEQIDRLMDVSGELTLVSQTSQAQIYAYRQGNWVAVAQLPCVNSFLLTKPTPLISCGDSVYFPSTSDSWLPLFPQLVRTVAADKQVFAQSAVEPTTFYIFDGLVLSSLTVDGFGEPLTVSLATFGSRYFLRGNQLWEVVLNPLPTLNAVNADPAAEIIAAAGADRLYLHTVSLNAVSDQSGNWQPITVVADYSGAFKTAQGWLLWKKNGSATQFASGSGTIYQMVAASWAGSSKIQEITSSGGTTLLWLYNSSNKPNLYRTTDFSQWTRITLPTNPTFPVTIAESRQLPAGTMVSIIGTVSVLPGTVATEVIYLQDETGGIQIFLSAAKGVLPAEINKLAEASGLISSSQVKRVTLDAADDLIMGAPNVLALPALTPTEAVGNLGRVFKLVGRVAVVTDDYLGLEATGEALRLHFKQLSTSFQPLDEGVFPAIIDFNSSSGRVEAWSLGDDELTKKYEELTDPQPVEPPAVSPPPPITQPENTPAPFVPTPPPPAPVKKVSSKQTTPKVNLTSSTKVSQAPSKNEKIVEEPLILELQDRKVQSTVPVGEVFVLSFLSLVAGVLSLRGRRFRHLLEG